MAAKQLPLIGVWVERDGKTFQNVSTANIPGAAQSMLSWAINAVRAGALSASVREFELAGPESAARGADTGRCKLITIVDWRDLPETVEAD